MGQAGPSCREHPRQACASTQRHTVGWRRLVLTTCGAEYKFGELSEEFNRCPVLFSPYCYAMSGTEKAYGGTLLPALLRDVWYWEGVCRYCSLRLATRCPVLRYATVLGGGEQDFPAQGTVSLIVLRRCYAMSGIDIGYAAAVLPLSCYAIAMRCA
eukprot:776889-Rhodomonas_salina.1